MKLNDLQLNSIYLKEISDAEAAKINGGSGDAASPASDTAATASLARYQALYQQIRDLSIKFQKANVPSKSSQFNKA